VKRIEKSIEKKKETDKRLSHNEVLYLLQSKTPQRIIDEYSMGVYNLYMKDIDFLIKTRDKKKNEKEEELFKKPEV
jgi:hypothetical protein